MATNGSRQRWLIVLGCAVVLGLAVAAFSLGHRARPEDPTAASVLNRSAEDACQSFGAFGEPLVVDWEAHQRIDLEESMHDGVAVVAASCKSLRLLHGCSVQGSYGFLATSRNEELVRLEDKNDLHANLGAVISSQLDAELDRDRSVDVAMVLVGKRRTTVDNVSRATLRGGPACAGATHFVHGAFVGAFAVGLGNKGKVNSVSKVFSGEGESSKVSHYRDGDEKSCDQLPTTAGAPSDRCHALVRLEIVALSEAGAGPRTAPPTEARTPQCAAGLVWSDGKCTARDATKVYSCDPGDAHECNVQCARGDASSCTTLGALYQRGAGVKREIAKARAYYKKGCDGGNLPGCFDLALTIYQVAGPSGDLTEAVALYERACQGDHALSCTNLGNMYELGRGRPRDFAQALSFYRRGCEGGNALGCTDVGLMYANGKAVEPDLAIARTYLRRGCEGGDPIGCVNLGTFYENGRGVERDDRQASELYDKACNAGSAFGCKALGFMAGNGRGVPRDYARARSLYQRACDQGYAGGCSNLGELHENGLGDVRDRDGALRLYRQGCQGGDPWGCEQLKRLHHPSEVSDRSSRFKPAWPPRP